MSVSDGNNDFSSSGNNSGKKDRRKRKILLASLAALALLSLFVLLGNPGLLIPDESGREAEAIDNGANDGNETSQEEASPIEEVVEVQSNVTNSSDGSVDSGSTSSNNGGSGGFVIVIDDGNGNGSTSSGGGRGGGGGGGGSNDDDDDDDEGSTGGNTNVNHSPVATNQQVSTDEDTPVMTNLTGSVTDSDGNPVTVSMVTSPSNGTVVLHANGSATYTPDNNYNGTDSFTYKANDGKADSNTANVIITILPVNDMPIALNATLTTLEDTPIPIELVNSTVDVDGDVVEIIIVTLPMNGLLEISDDNTTVTYTPLQNYHEQDSFEYKLTDTVYNSTVGIITIDVISVNDPPVLTGELDYEVDEDETLAMHILPLFTDADGDNLTIEITETENGTSVLYENGTVTYTPMPDYHGQDSFDATVSDGGQDGSVTETVTITIKPVNDAPMSNDIEVTTEEDVPVDIQLSATDKEEDDLTYSFISPPTNGTIGEVDENGIVTYTPNLNYNGTDSFTFRANDTSIGNIATVSITITFANDNPVANDDLFNIELDAVTPLDVLENDVDIDGHTLTIESVTQPEHGSVSINEAGDMIIYTPEEGNSLAEIFQYTASDGNGGSGVATVTVHIDVENDAPTAHDVNAVTDEETPVEITLLASDPDAVSALSFTIIDPPTKGVLSGFSATEGTVTYTPNLNINGVDVDSFTFQVSDGIEDSNFATVTITVLPLNDDPVAVDDAFDVAEDGTLNANVLDNDFDVDGDSLGTDAFGPQTTDHGTVTMNTDGSFEYVPEADYNGQDSFQYTMTDGNGGMAIGTVSINVGSENDLPVANDDYAFTTMEAPVLIKVLLNDSDIDGDSLQVIQAEGASNGTVEPADGGQAVIYTPNADFTGTDQFTYTVSDGNGGIATATVTVEVYPATFGHLQPPVGGSGTHEFEQGNTASVRFKLFDDVGQEIKDAQVILMIQQVDNSNNPIGPVMEATSAGGSNDGNLFKYSNSFYQYNLKTDTMETGKWALYVYLLDGEDQILMEDAPIDGISATILIK